jgi:hypothetical protein
MRGMTNTHTKSYALATVALLAVGLLIAACHPALAPVALPESSRCETCLRRKCVSEAVACGDDPSQAQSKDGTRCICWLGCRRLLHHPAAECLAHCGAADATYDALASCLDVNCADRCEQQPKEAP